MHYNQVAMLPKMSRLFLLIIITLTQTAFVLSASLQAPSAYDLIVEVNSYRLSMGYYALNPDSLVITAAQGHADWIVATGQGGHIGAHGSDETMRVAWAGYGGGAAIQCDEAWASGRTIKDVVYTAWSDWEHQEVMLNGWGNPYTDIGAGVADKGDGTYVFVVNICMIKGADSGSYLPSATRDPNATADLSNYIFGVTKATPAADGSVIHIVKYGQTLATIAEAYGITINALRALNNMSADNTNIWPDQKLIIIKGNGTPLAITPSVSGTPDETPSLPQTYTPRSATRTLIPTLVINNKDATIAPVTQTTAESDVSPSKTIGMVLIILCGMGVIALIYFFFLKK
ncbi:MAG: hypothetical protein C0391_08555 [Anaerolinea sp.]|nr:hypothetical protein [Anaerolinea sp.]